MKGADGRSIELRVNVQEFLAARSHQTTMLVSSSSEHQNLALERMSNLLCERRVLHSIATIGGVKTIVSVDDLPALWSCAAACGGTMNMRKQAGPMPEFIMNELCCAMVIMALKMNGYVAIGEQGTYLLPKQTRPDEVQCVQFSSMKLVHNEVVCVFTPVVYHLNKADSIVHTLRQGAMGMQISDDTFTRQLQSMHSVFALPYMNACHIVEYSSHPQPMMGNLHGCNLHTPQTDDDYRKHWKAVHGMTLPQDVGGYIRVQFPSGEVMTFPAVCIATNWHILAKQTRMEANDITRKLVLSMHSFFGVSAVAVRSESNESKMGSLLPASALLQTGTGSMTPNAVLARKRNDHQAPALTKRKKIY